MDEENQRPELQNSENQKPATQRSGSQRSEGQRSGAQRSESRRVDAQKAQGQRTDRANRPPLTEAQRARRRALRKKRRRQQMMRKIAILAAAVVLVLLVAIIAVLKITGSKKTGDSQTAAVSGSGSVVSASAAATSVSTVSGSAATSTTTATDPRSQAIAEADYLNLTYDYDAAIEKLQSIEGYENDSEIQAKIAEIENTKANLVAWDMDNITHIFYHSLVVDPERAFNQGNSGDDGFKEWMTTVTEFDAITQQMYDRGYVLISLYDMVDQTVDENGEVHFTVHQLYLPEGKIPYVLSLDDLSYYHSYNGRGTATRMIIGEDGTPTCEYVDADGNTLVGSYDCVPRMDDFLEAHPDASYRGAKGTIALTGYDGILGYRTDIAYKTGENLDQDQADYLAANPDFDWDEECAEAKAVADCIKADGWTFASHTWGHIRVGDNDLTRLQADTEKWLAYVAPLIGGSDIIIFAHGQDLGDWNDYAVDNEKFNYLKSQGFNFFCNVDSSQYFLQIRDNYVRQGRRNLDGYRLWNDVHGDTNKTSDLFDAATVLDPARTDMPEL